MPSEFVIRGATILDGTGRDEFVADVVVRGDSVVSVGSCQSTDLPAIEAEGLYLAPGFIDAHCHDDLALLRNPDRSEKVAQGVTTVVVGNCGFSLFPCSPESRKLLRGHAGGLLGSMGTDELFDDIKLYSQAVLAKGSAINVVPLVGHGPLRLEVLGYDDRPATESERLRMADRLESQLRIGAAGLSLGLVYPPSAFADRAELLALCGVAARCGKPVAAHIRSYEAGLLLAVEEFLDLLRVSRARGVLSHLQAAGRPNWGLVLQALSMLEAANDDGIDVGFDMYPYLAGSSYALQLLPPSSLAGGIERLNTLFRSSDSRAGLKQRLEEPGVGDDGWQSKVAIIGWESVLIAGSRLSEFEGLTIAEAAVKGGCEPFDILERLVLEEDGATAVVLFQLSETDLKSAFRHPFHMVGSDGIPREMGRPHPRAFGAFPRVIDKVVKSDRWLSLPDAVRRMTSEPAKRFGLTNRGVIQPGATADLVLFDSDFRDNATYKDPRGLATGARYVWVAGQVVLADGKPTGCRPGRIV